MRTLVLAGAGHGHIQILNKLKKKSLKDLRVILVTNFDRQVYSGMLAGYINGTYSLDDISFKIEDYRSIDNLEIVYDTIVEIDKGKSLVIGEKSTYSFDILSMDLGSSSVENFGPEKDGLYYVKPIYNFKDLKDLDPGVKRLLIVGAGASGLELALAYRSKYPDIDIILADRNTSPISTFNRLARHLSKRTLEKRNIDLALGLNISKIEGKKAYSNKGTIDFDQALVATGLKGVDVKFTAFEKDDKNFIKVNDQLFAGDNILAIGDMVQLESYPDLPKAGVFAIRMTPVLIHNIFEILKGSRSFISYRPQKIYLQIVNTSDKKAILSYGPIAFHSRLALWIKDRIDSGYMEDGV